MLDRESRFREAVIGDFADSYARGETPIPCVRCNQTVKFQDLVGLARDLGCEALATGHYARRVDGPGGPELHRAADPARDQSYFLFATTREQLAFARFPLGDMPDKAAVRREAVRLGLAVAEKPDSQDICFVPQGRYHDLVAKLRPEAAEAGEIVDGAGRVLGRHQGVGRYTVGQARGLGLPGEAGLRVASLDAATRRVVVAPAASIAVPEVRVGEVNWLAEAPVGPFAAMAKFRAREVPQPATAAWNPETREMVVRPDRPVISAPGQGCVLYDGERVLGGGFIRAAAAPRTAREAPARNVVDSWAAPA